MGQIAKEQRYEIHAYLKAEKPKAYIAKELGVHVSTIYREIKRNAQKRGGYNAKYAQTLCDEAKERYGRNRKFDINMKRIIDDKVGKEQWSPKQIIGYCKKQGIEMVSHERIYQYIRQDKTDEGNLYKQLRHRLKHRKRAVGADRIPIKDRVSIDERPKEVDEKSRFGDWEIDTIIGKDGKGAIVTIVERTTAFFMMRKLVNGKHAKDLASTVVDMLLPYKNSVHTITSDNGTEFANHVEIATALDLKFFFAHPYSSWERGLSEYTNKLIRQYIPKKSDFKQFSDSYIAEIQYKINRRPREKLNFECPKTIFYNFVL